MRYGVASWVALLALAGFFACSDEVAPAPSRGGDATSSSSSSGAPSGGDDDDGGPADAGPADAVAPFVDYDINHVLSTGQSLSVGAVGSPALSTTQPFDNLTLRPDAFAPLVETRVETMSSALANLATQLATTEIGLPRHDLLVTVHGVGGYSYAQLKKGTAPYANGVAQARSAADLAKALGKSYVVRAVTNVHGETDHNLNSLTYREDITAWQADYEADVKAITGQSEPIPMLHTQMSSFTKLGGAGGSATSRIPLDQLAVHVSSGGKTVLVGPKYHLPYVADGVHLTNEGYRHMGEDYAKVYRRVVLERQRWEPLRPISVTRAGATVTVRFAVPAPPLVLDTTTVTDPGSFGFEVVEDGGAAPAIERVAVTAPDTVTIQLAAAPTGQNRRLRYAMTGVPRANGGPTTGARGNLRDSDATRSRSGYDLWNWCVHFEESLP